MYIYINIYLFGVCVLSTSDRQRQMQHNAWLSQLCVHGQAHTRKPAALFHKNRHHGLSMTILYPIDFHTRVRMWQHTVRSLSFLSTVM